MCTVTITQLKNKGASLEEDKVNKWCIEYYSGGINSGGIILL